MNSSFKYYGKQPQTKIAKEALTIQSKYNLNDMQLAGLLQINDFFQRIVLFDTHVSNLRISEHLSNESHLLPSKTRDFFMDIKKCDELKKYFNPNDAHRSFQRFADKILGNITKLSDYVAVGLIQRIPERNIVPTVYEYKA